MAQFAADRRVVQRLGRLHLVWHDDHVVDQHAGHAYRLQRQRAGGGQALHLGNDDAAIVMRGECLVIHAEVRTLVLHRDVAQRVGGGSADDGHIHRDRA